MAVVFNKNKSSYYIWFNLTYQSNNLLNDYLTHDKHMDAKVFISNILIKNCGIKIAQIHSFVHGNIIFSINRNSHIEQIFDKIVNELQEPLSKYTPQLFFNLSIVGIDEKNPWTNFMYIDGYTTLDDNFQKKIKHLLE